MKRLFVAFLDADDRWYPQKKLEQQVALFDELIRQGRPVGLVDCYVHNDYSDGKRILEKPAKKR
ncbi:hypothetical protein ACFS4T_18660 [Pseudomonas lini]